MLVGVEECVEDRGGRFACRGERCGNSVSSASNRWGGRRDVLEDPRWSAGGLALSRRLSTGRQGVENEEDDDEEE